ncbi:MAG: DEAD/DEAH box helicase [Nitriliruptoraceae bacterium]
MTAPTDVTSFAELGLDDRLVSTLHALGYEEPTPIQREAIGPLLVGRDLLGQAATGTGKTAAFALPLLQRLPPGDRGVHPTGLVLVPTRELAMQVSEAVHAYGRAVDARVLPVYGGQPIWRQLKALARGVDVVVATPGRAVDHLARGTLHLDDLEVVVLDEADEMLDMGFAEDLDAIIAATPPTRQTVLFSATLPSRIDQLARRYLHEPLRVTISLARWGCAVRGACRAGGSGAARGVRARRAGGAGGGCAVRRVRARGVCGAGVGLCASARKRPRDRHQPELPSPESRPSTAYMSSPATTLRSPRTPRWVVSVRAQPCTSETAPWTTMTFRTMLE